MKFSPLSLSVSLPLSLSFYLSIYLSIFLSLQRTNIVTHGSLSKNESIFDSFITIFITSKNKYKTITFNFSWSHAMPFLVKMHFRKNRHAQKHTYAHKQVRTHTHTQTLPTTHPHAYTHTYTHRHTHMSGAGKPHRKLASAEKKAYANSDMTTVQVNTLSCKYIDKHKHSVFC